MKVQRALAPATHQQHWLVIGLDYLPVPGSAEDLVNTAGANMLRLVQSFGGLGCVAFEHRDNSQAPEYFA